ncbi:MAG: AAA family ATPase [Patescibacteria group bacterium]|nr:AAA family ATPase [Patescibacteria group bacterium]
MDGRIIINISGKSTSGKTTLMRELASRNIGWYSLFRDRVKKQFSGYSRERDREVIEKVVFGFYCVLCEKGLPILLDASIDTRDAYSEYLKVAEKNHYKFLSINLDIPQGVALKRFRERVRRAKDQGDKISVTDEDTFLRNQNKEHFYPSDALSFDTSRLTVEEIASDIMDKIVL